MRKSFFPIVCLLALSTCAAPPAQTASALPTNPQSDITITPDFRAAGTPIPEDFIGLSYETRMVLPDSSDRYYFHPQTPQLVPLFKSLGIRSLRIGGNTADRDTVNIPTNRDLSALFAFAKAADCKIIYNLRLKNTTDPTDDVRIVKFIMSNYKPLLSSFTIGNEPDFYFKTDQEYLAQFKKFSAAILAQVPDAQFCGPSTAGHQEWAISLAHQMPAPQLAYVTLHTYPGGDAQAPGSAPKARAHILSPDMETFYEKFDKNFLPAITPLHLSYRLEECNSLYNGGASNISNSFASTLWALDFMYWHASHGCLGVNFHTGTTPAPSDNRIPGGYDAFWTSPTGIRLHPISYALKSFAIAAHGKIIPATVSTLSADHPNVTEYCVIAKDAFYVTLINRTVGTSVRHCLISINAGPFTHAEALPILAPHNDDGALDGVTLGGAGISGNGDWNGTWTPVSSSQSPGVFLYDLPATSAVVLKFTR